MMLNFTRSSLFNFVSTQPDIGYVLSYAFFLFAVRIGLARKEICSVASSSHSPNTDGVNSNAERIGYSEAHI